MELVESAGEVFKDPAAEVKAVFGEKVNPVQLVKLVTAAGGVSDNSSQYHRGWCGVWCDLSLADM
jgi:hypothetical protein